MIIKLIREVYNKVKGEVLAFDFALIDNLEGRNKFNQMMDSVGLSQLFLGRYLMESNYEDNLAKLMLTKTKTLVRIYFVEGFNFA